MSLNKIALEAALIVVLTQQQTKKSDPAKSIKEIAAGIASAIDDYVRSGTVTVNVTTTVLTTGSATTQTGTGQGTGTGTIN
jgi:UDP-N-acetylmuramyl tripeptide synthase